MNHSSSSSLSSSSSQSSAQYTSSIPRWEERIPYGRESQHQQHQEREWLSCSTSSDQQQLQDASPQEEDEVENEEEDHQVTQIQGEGNINIVGSDNNDIGVVVEREHMFDKVVTPSDVGKLNRLVIPKQHAEKYFPLNSSTTEKAGLLLNFEDLTGKTWRFRYSYWNSSQSYVMTKGWSRFVKEKRLSAGDIVSFQRGVGHESKFFIDWRRRPVDQHQHHHLGTAFAVPTAATWTLLRSQHPGPHDPHSHPWGGGGTGTIWDHPSSSSNSSVGTTHVSPISMMSMVPYPYGSSISSSSSSSNSNLVNYPYPAGRGSLIFLRSSPTILSASPTALDPHYRPSHIITPLLSNDDDLRGGDHENKVYESVPVVQGNVGGPVAKRSLRLFGVNMDCAPISNEDHQLHNQQPQQRHENQEPVVSSPINSMELTMNAAPNSTSTSNSSFSPQ